MKSPTGDNRQRCLLRQQAALGNQAGSEQHRSSEELWLGKSLTHTKKLTLIPTLFFSWFVLPVRLSAEVAWHLPPFLHAGEEQCQILRSS